MATIRTKIRFTALDAVVIALLALAGVFLAHRIQTSLGYDWDWGAIAGYLVRFDQGSNSYVAGLITQGLLTTLRLSVFATILATALGAVMGLLAVGKGFFSRLIVRAYVETVRNLPPLVLVFLFYFFFSDRLMTLIGLDQAVRSAPEWLQATLSVLFAPPSLFTAFFSALLTLAVYEGAYITEIVRAGIQSVEKGQWEAANALGLSRFQRMRHVIMPQAVRRILPPLTGQLISTVKDSAIVSVISIQELTFQGMEAMAATYRTFEIWTTVLVLYLVVCLGLSLASRRLEVWMERRGG
ncbi:MAG: amino acid ABC transporter permease [Thermodesulfobacteriota bacterium]|nr:amino acid ABC transporter permease [Thermodesulfobacteriota bacterium]